VAKNLFFLGIIFAASGVVGPPVALGLGLAFGLAFLHPFPQDTRQLSKLLLQLSVVALGFGMDLRQVLEAGRAGFVYTALSIGFVLLAGTGLGRLLAVQKRVSFLISTGTAICGGSAIAAVSPILGASEEEIAVSLGTVFVLNSIGLLVFPPIGFALHLTQTQFGLWAALAIHDTSSVVGAAARYGAVALSVATTVKLVRALWIVPVSIGVSLNQRGKAQRSKTQIQWPWFIALFLVAAGFNTFLPGCRPLYSTLQNLGITGLCVTLFLIGTSLSRGTLKAVGFRPMLQGVILWLAVSAGSLWMIQRGWIR
jgi:uncharacterized integral membrane protein (TIGR00698 family)